MTAHEPLPDRERERRAGPSPPGGLLDLISVTGVVLGTRGRIVFWSPQADEVFFTYAEEALGQYATQLVVRSTRTC